MAFLAAMGGGGGMSASSSTGPQTSRGGDIGGASISFQGITNNAKVSPWIYAAGALLVVGALWYMNRKR